MLVQLYIKSSKNCSNFIKKVIQTLGAKELIPVKGDVFKFISSCRESFDFIFADPPYDLPRLNEIPKLILSSSLLKPNGLLVVEHSKNNDFSSLPEFEEHRVYGSVNFSFFRNLANKEVNE